MMNQLRSARVLMTGGTGFVGRAMWAYFTEANRMLGLDAALYIPSRRAQVGWEEADGVHIIPGDADTCAPPGDITHIIHLEPGRSSRVFALAEQFKCPLLFASSGAARVDSDYPDKAYIQNKRSGEVMCWWAWQEKGLLCKIARLWSFVGPHLPLDSMYAIGNFIRDGLNGGPIVVHGDGMAVRSYMYSTDLAEWMWTILLRGRAGEIYNVGSEDAITIADVAAKIACHCNLYRINPGLPKIVPDVILENGGGATSSRYVPNTGKTRRELGLMQKVGLDEAITKTIEWNKSNAKSIN